MTDCIGGAASVGLWPPSTFFISFTGQVKILHISILFVCFPAEQLTNQAVVRETCWAVGSCFCGNREADISAQSGL